jgi:hypothetical protein
MMLFSDRSTPVSYRYADIFSINTYKFTKPVRSNGMSYLLAYIIPSLAFNFLSNDVIRMDHSNMSRYT